jgi:hypothetical protein
VVRGVRIGLVPRYLCQWVAALLSAAGEQAQARVQRVNPPPTPAQFRVLCSLDAPWPEGFRPLAHPDFEALPCRAPVGSRVARVGSIRAMTGGVRSTPGAPLVRRSSLLSCFVLFNASCVTSYRPSRTFVEPTNPLWRWSPPRDEVPAASRPRTLDDTPGRSLDKRYRHW